MRIVTPFRTDRGAYRDRHEAWCGMRWTCWRGQTSGANADGKAVWSCPPDAGDKLVDNFTSDGGYQARHSRESAE
jgi:hypothetical protein